MLNLRSFYQNKFFFWSQSNEIPTWNNRCHFLTFTKIFVCWLPKCGKWQRCILILKQTTNSIVFSFFLHFCPLAWRDIFSWHLFYRKILIAWIFSFTWCAFIVCRMLILCIVEYWNVESAFNSRSRGTNKYVGSQ